MKESAARNQRLQQRQDNFTALESAILSAALAQSPFVDHRRRVFSHKAFKDLILSLIQQSRLSDAVKVYEYMVKEGFIVSPSLEARMLAISVSRAVDQPKRILLSKLKLVVQKEAFSPDDLLKVLGTMSDLDLPAEMLMDITSTFSKSHTITGLHQLDFDFLQNFASEIVGFGDASVALDALSALPPDANEIHLSEAYASFIKAIRKSVSPSRESVSAALHQMEKQGIPPSLSIWNSLIAFEVRTNSLHRPFAIFDALRSRSEFLPDHDTFGSLFKALNRFYNPKRRRYRHGRSLPDNIPSPRMLFREMLDRFILHPQFHLTTTLLNAILRPFVFSKDYAGALQVLRLFHYQGIRINVKTYFIVFRHLMNRVTYGIRAARKMGSVPWADRFLSLPSPVHDPTFLNNLQLSNPLAAHILNISKCIYFALDRPLYLSNQSFDAVGHALYRTPTVEQMLGKEVVSLTQRFNRLPLERLLQKALLAEMQLVQELPPGDAVVSALSTMITSVEQEMIPPELQISKEKKEELIQLIQLARIVAWTKAVNDS